MSDVLVTITAPTRRLDLVLPGDQPIRELIPQLVDLCVDPTLRTASARWAIGRMGTEPLGPNATLAQIGILDGAVLYLRDMTSSPIPQLAAVSAGGRVVHPDVGTVPSGAVAQALAAKAGSDASELVGRASNSALLNEKSTTRWDLEACWSNIALPMVLAAGGIFWALSTGAGRESHSIGAAAAVGILILFLVVVWLLGFLPWLGEQLHISSFRNFPAAPGLSHPNDNAPTGLGGEGGRNERVNQLAELFVFDLGRLLSGERPDLSYCDEKVVKTLDASVQPVLRAGERIIPDFGGHADVQVRWPTSIEPQPVVAVVTFDDRSVRETTRGERLAVVPRKVRVVLTMNSSLSRVIDAIIQPLS